MASRVEEGITAEPPQEDDRVRGTQSCAPTTMGLVILAMSLIAFMSPPELWLEKGLKGDEESAAETTQLMGRLSNESLCMRGTGGTCFITGCLTARGHVSCEVEHSLIGVLGWHSCNCIFPTPCAHSDGKCYSVAEASWPEWLKKQDQRIALLAIAPLLRSGVTKSLSGLLAIDHLMSVPSEQPIKLFSFRTIRDWTHMRDESNYKYKFQAVVVSGIKLACFHLPQPFLFILPYVAYFDAMGWVQRIFGFLALLEEFFYLFLIAYGLYVNRKWLLFAPQSDDDEVALSRYLFFPTLFIIDSCYLTHTLDLVLTGLASFTGLAASIGSLVAVTAGLLGQGVMTPTLLIGYSLSGSVLFWLVVVVLRSQPTDRR